MKKIRVILLLSVCVLARVVNAQEETEKADTVIITKDPVILRKQVIANPAPTEPIKTQKKWSLEAFFLTGKPILVSTNSTQLTPYFFHNCGLLLNRHSKNFELGIGVHLVKSSFQYQKTNTYTNVITYDSSYTALLDSYIQNIGGRDTTIYITEQRDTSITKTTSTTSIQTGNPSFTYINIPVTIGYKINIWKERLYVIPRAQFMYGILVQSSLEGYDSPKTSTFGYAAQLNLMYTFAQRYSILGKAQWQSNVTSPYPSVNMHSLTYGMGLAVHF